MVKRLILVFTLLLAPLILAPAASAIDVFPEGNNGVCRQKNNANQGAVCIDEKNNGNPIVGPNGVITNLVNLLTIILGIVAVINIILGGLKFVTSGNNPQDVVNARERVIYALVAVVLGVLAQVIVKFVLSKL